MPFQPNNPPIHQSINPLRSVRAITFDVGGTLIQPWPSVGHIYAEVAARHGLRDIPFDSLNRQFAAAWKNLIAFNYARSEWHSLVNRTFLGLTEVPVSDSFFSDLYACFAQAEAWRIFDDVLPALEFLHSHGLKLGIISNWDERLRPLLRQLNLDRFFQSIIVSCEVGQCKPSATTFNRAAESLGFPPASILHIGDHPILDVDGADSAGFQTLLLTRKPIATPDRLNSLNRLQEIFK
jgi:putative hydrolase of the HAD superfamily